MHKKIINPIKTYWEDFRDDRNMSGYQYGAYLGGEYAFKYNFADWILNCVEESGNGTGEDGENFRWKNMAPPR